jgi:hypothetical protein
MQREQMQAWWQHVANLGWLLNLRCRGSGNYACAACDPIQKRRTEWRGEKVDSGKVTEDEAIFQRCIRATTDANARSATARRIAVLAARYPSDRRVAAYQSLPLPVH